MHHNLIVLIVGERFGVHGPGDMFGLVILVKVLLFKNFLLFFADILLLNIVQDWSVVAIIIGGVVK